MTFVYSKLSLTCSCRFFTKPLVLVRGLFTVDACFQFDCWLVVPSALAFTLLASLCSIFSWGSLTLVCRWLDWFRLPIVSTAVRSLSAALAPLLFPSSISGSTTSIGRWTCSQQQELIRYPLGLHTVLCFISKQRSRLRIYTRRTAALACVWRNIYSLISRTPPRLYQLGGAWDFSVHHWKR